MKFSVNTASESPSGCGSFAGKGVGTLFFGIFFLVGSLFVVVILGEALNQLAPWWWPEVECTIVASGIGETGEDEHPYRALVTYRYLVDGRAHESSRLSRKDSGTASFDRARDLAERYQPGAKGSCRVSPDHPSLAVLERSVPWIAFAVLFPMIFVAIGGGGLWATWRRSSSKEKTAVQSISQNATSGRGRQVMIFVGLIFAGVGAAVFVPMAGIPATRFAESMTWKATPCTVVSSNMRSWSTDDGTSFRADVLYEYQSGGRAWRSNRVDFFSFITTGRADARAVLDRFPTGSTTLCWVDPANPAKSVLERQFRAQHLLGLIPLVFVVVGLALANHGRKSVKPDQEPGEIPVEQTAVTTDPLVLKPQLGPVGKVGGSLFFALFWNGIVSVFVWQAFKGWEQGSPDWFLTIFLIPFVLVGLFSVGAVGHFILALANPRPRLILTPGHPRLGDTLRLEWGFSGRAGRLENLRIYLEGREEATYRRGTDTHTDREVFATLDLVDTANDWEIPQGSSELPIPSDTMHSFTAASNKIVWEIKIEGEIARWPDVSQNFPITIHPMHVEDL